MTVAAKLLARSSECDVDVTVQKRCRDRTIDAHTAGGDILMIDSVRRLAVRRAKHIHGICTYRI